MRLQIQDSLASTWDPATMSRSPVRSHRAQFWTLIVVPFQLTDHSRTVFPPFALDSWLTVSFIGREGASRMSGPVQRGVIRPRVRSGDIGNNLVWGHG